MLVYTATLLLLPIERINLNITALFKNGIFLPSAVRSGANKR